jgi:hypothetical protein
LYITHTPPGGGDTTVPHKASLAVLGSWSRTVSLLSLPGLAPVASQELGSDIIPRSVALADFDGQPYVLCGMGDGQLHNWRLDPGSGTLSGEWCVCVHACVRACVRAGLGGAGGRAGSAQLVAV